MRKIYLEKIGADPEVFFQTKQGFPVSAEGLIGGSKKKPKPMEGLPEGFCIQEDNVAAEYNIPPSSDREEFANNIIQGLKYVAKQAKDQGLRLAIVPDLDFPLEMVLTPHARRLGCDPDLNAWEEKENPTPIPPVLMRTAAGHVHLSWGKPDNEQRSVIVRALDVALGLPSIVATDKNRRRELYGKAGACRFKDYGVEYRVLDNFWLKSKARIKHVFDACFNVANRLNYNGLFPEELLMDRESIINAINNHDKELAIGLMQKYEVPAFPA